MHEYAAFNPYNASPEALAAELTRKAADGWEVVSIVTTHDGRYCAFLRRPIAAGDAASGAARGAGAPGHTATGAQTAPATTSTHATTASSAPAAWYADPSGRYELRYWNGREWTEHVARGGQQYTDPPRA